jgi:hypothetical protein
MSKIYIANLNTKLDLIAMAHGVKGHTGIAKLLGLNRASVSAWTTEKDGPTDHVPESQFHKLIELVASGAQKPIGNPRAKELLFGDAGTLAQGIFTSGGMAWGRVLADTTDPDCLSLKKDVVEFGITRRRKAVASPPQAVLIKHGEGFGFVFKAPANSGEVVLLRRHDREWRSIGLGQDEEVIEICSGHEWYLPGFEDDGSRAYLVEYDDRQDAVFVVLGVPQRFSQSLKDVVLSHQPLRPSDLDQIAELWPSEAGGRGRIGQLPVWFADADLD